MVQATELDTIICTPKECLECNNICRTGNPCPLDNSINEVQSWQWDD